MVTFAFCSFSQSCSTLQNSFQKERKQYGAQLYRSRALSTEGCTSHTLLQGHLQISYTKLYLDKITFSHILGKKVSIIGSRTLPSPPGPTRVSIIILMPIVASQIPVQPSREQIQLPNTALRVPAPVCIYSIPARIVVDNSRLCLIIKSRHGILLFSNMSDLLGVAASRLH